MFDKEQKACLVLKNLNIKQFKRRKPIFLSDVIFGQSSTNRAKPSPIDMITNSRYNIEYSIYYLHVF